jgi:lysozyme
MNLGLQGEALIKHFESCRLQAYQDSVGIWTIGWGNTKYENGARVKEGDSIPQWRADQLFSRIIQRFINNVNCLTQGAQLQQHQFDALVSFDYNTGRLSESTLLKLVLNNPENPDIPAEFSKWRKAGGKVLPGLVRRRQSEALF